MERETRLVSCSLAFNGNSAFCFQQFHRFQTKALQPQLAHATRFVARSSPLTKTNKKKPFSGLLFISGRLGSNSRHPPWQFFHECNIFSICNYFDIMQLIQKQGKLHINYTQITHRIFRVNLFNF